MNRWYHGAIIGALLCLVAGLFLTLRAPVDEKLSQQTSIIAPADKTPEVAAIVLKKVPLATAKKINAAIPFTRSSVPASARFDIQGSSLDTARAVDCLASAIYYEAGNEALEGQKAVAQVILNRVRHPAYPKTICGVVYQGQERSTGCQFSFSCDGSMARIPAAALWQRLRNLSQSMLTGTVYAPVGWATHYHTDWVVPVWSAKLDKIRAEATHLFFRWTGFWGTPAAFRGRYVGGEPNIPKLARLSSAHSGLVGDAQSLNPTLGTFPVIVPESDNKVSVSGKNGEFILSVDRGVVPAFLPILAARTCGDRDYCKLFMWTNTSKMPAGFPVDQAQLATAAFSFLRNRSQNFEKSLWNCAQFPDIDRKQCIKRRIVIEGKVEELIPVEPDIAEVITKPAPPETRVLETSTEPQSTARRRPGR